MICQADSSDVGTNPHQGRPLPHPQTNPDRRKTAIEGREVGGTDECGPDHFTLTQKEAWFYRRSNGTVSRFEPVMHSPSCSHEKEQVVNLISWRVKWKPRALSSFPASFRRSHSLQCRSRTSSRQAELSCTGSQLSRNLAWGKGFYFSGLHFFEHTINGTSAGWPRESQHVWCSVCTNLQAGFCASSLAGWAKPANLSEAQKSSTSAERVSSGIDKQSVVSK